MSPAESSALRELVQRELGIQMPASKDGLLRSRLARRLRELGLDSLSEYHARVVSRDARELTTLFDAVTTNKTDFWREPDHFRFVAKRALPELESPHAGVWKVWSAGCSTGEEAYTLAMVMDHVLCAAGDARRFVVLGTDISTRALEHARRGIYTTAQVAPLPSALRRRYVRRGRAVSDDRVRVVPQLRRCVRFHRLNFMEPSYGIRAVFDLVFFRNVAIYFDAPTQRAVVAKLAALLRPGGYLFIGHSESSAAASVAGLRPAGAAIFRKTTP